MSKPEYSEKLLIRLILETKNLEDLVALGKLILELEEQGDVNITQKIILTYNIKQEEFTYKK